MWLKYYMARILTNEWVMLPLAFVIFVTVLVFGFYGLALLTEGSGPFPSP